MSGFFKSMQISASGLAAQRMRMNILSTNLANAQTTRTPEGGPYRRQDVVLSAIPTGSPFQDFLDDTMETQLRQVRVVDIHQDQTAPKEIFDPHHSDADARGYVKMPNIQVMPMSAQSTSSAITCGIASRCSVAGDAYTKR